MDYLTADAMVPQSLDMLLFLMSCAFCPSCVTNGHCSHALSGARQRQEDFHGSGRSFCRFGVRSFSGLDLSVSEIFPVRNSQAQYCSG